MKVRLCENADCFSHINKAIVLGVRAFHFMMRMHGCILGMLLWFSSHLLQKNIVHHLCLCVNCVLF